MVITSWLGCTVEQWRPSTLEVCKVALDVARGMSYLHGRPKPLIHRDLKSPNLLFTTSPKQNSKQEPILVKIADFGISRDKHVENNATLMMTVS